LKKEKKQAKEQPIKTSTKKNKTKKRKKRNKNKGYHPHYLKGKK
ncbi:MAG: ATP-dependent helicase, partial [Lactobacillus crispatus]|nr:ATP-dependent helicase [Lactobacillus crispatus]